MSADWYPGIRAFCLHWRDALMLQDTFSTFELEFSQDHDACIDAAKGIVECACRVIIEELDDPANPLKPAESAPPIHSLVGAATRLLKLGDVRHKSFQDLVRRHNDLTAALRVLRNEAGTVSHGKDGFIAKLSEHHRRAAVLSADAIIMFLHTAYLEREPDPVRTNEPYERFAYLNDEIDEQTSIAAEITEAGLVSVVVRLPGGDEIPLTIETSRLLFYIDRQAYKQAAIAVRQVSSAKPADDIA
jgi:hypothetical protein